MKILYYFFWWIILYEQCLENLINWVIIILCCTFGGFSSLKCFTQSALKIFWRNCFEGLLCRCSISVLKFGIFWIHDCLVCSISDGFHISYMFLPSEPTDKKPPQIVTYPSISDSPSSKLPTPAHKS